jgi:P-type Ca2+ transporter type 2C
VRAASVAIYARVIPEQKLRLVEVLKANGEIVAMTGDGVNDAPALKAAQIGIAMGERGTDVAREAAGLVLLDDDFASLVRAVRLGRRIFDNLKKAMAYLIAVHVPIAGMSLLPVVFGWPIVLFPVHIVFLELIIDPACSIVFEAEPEEPGIMNRRPRNPDEPLLSARTVSLAFLQGASVLAIVLAVFLVALRMGRGPQDARTVAFVSLVLSNLALILSNRSWSRPIAEAGRRRNPALAWMAGAALLMLSLTLVMPPIRELFRFSALSSVDILVCVAASAAGVLWFEVFKLLRRRSGRARPGRIGRDGRAAD